jgi:mannose-1-phosphate guanylyltransferase
MDKEDYKSHIFALILAGGGGTRLWPKSLEKSPKQFLKLFKKKSLIEITAERLNKFLPWERIFVVTTTRPYGEEIRRLLPRLPKENIIVEPVRKDSAPAHGIGALYISKIDPEAVIINAASDHLVSPTTSYIKTMHSACRYAFSGDRLVAVGVKPAYPHTGMGHLRRGKKLEVVNGRNVYKLDQFVEKPPLELAKRYTASGHYFWNANMYVWRADTFLKSLKLHAPKIGSGMATIAEAIGTGSEKEVIAREYNKFPKISVDYAVSEKAKNFFMLVADYNWTDIGDWNEVWKNLPKDSMGNVIIDGDEPGGEVMNIDTSDALVHTDGRLIAIIDVDNVVVVDTKDALLICNKSRAQNVKKIVEELKARKKFELV